MRNPLVPFLLASTCLLAAPGPRATAQQPETSWRSTRAGLPGDRPGTERWLITFKARSFELDRFRAAVYARRPAAEVQEIVDGMRAQVTADQAPFAAWIESLGGRVVAQWWIVNGCAVEVPPAALPLIRILPVVDRMDPDEVILPLAGSPTPIVTSTNAANHNSDAANASGFKGAGVATAIVDTGVDHAYSGTPGIPHATFYVNGSKTNHSGPGIDGSRLLACKQIGLATCDDLSDHGTGVASIVAGEKWNTGPTSDRGHAPSADIVAYSIADDALGSATYASIVTAWNAVAADRVALRIATANNSYTGSPDPVHTSQQALDSCALNADVLICVAAGNSAASTSGSQSAANGLAVGAVDANAKTVAGFSSRGPLALNPARFYPDLAACGVNTVMAKRDNEAGQYVTSGTSMASPQACGAATLFRAIRGQTALEAKAALLATAEDVSAQNPGLDRNAYGAGFVRSDLIVGAVPFEDTVAAASLTKTYSLPVTQGRFYSVAIAWYRTVLTVPTWSDLDLRVLDGTTEVVRSSAPANLYERVVFVARRSGSLTIEVTGVTLDAASVRFALCVLEVAVRRIPGDYQTYGVGCKGTGGGGGVVPLLTNGGVPEIGRPFDVRLSFARPAAPVLLFIGFSKTSWLGVPLPFDLGQIGAPGCFLNAPGQFVQAGAADAGGSSIVTLPVPLDPTLVQARVFNQFIVVDLAANQAGVVTSRGGAALLGGQP